VLLKTENLNIGFKNKGIETKIVSNINLEINKNELIALVGINGSGKSSLIKTLLKFQKSLAGEIFIHNKNLKEIAPKELSEQISYVSSKLVEQNNITAKNIISLGRLPYTKWFGILSNNDKKIVDEIITTFNIENIAEKQFNNLSDGEKQKILIARAFAQDTDLIILDEPSSHLDISGKYEVVKLLKKLTLENNKAVIFSTHDLNIAFANADIIWFIFNGKIISGKPKEIVNNSDFKNIFKSSNLSVKEQIKIINSLIV
jgi:iron complex transport system ATP-binding protein